MINKKNKIMSNSDGANFEEEDKSFTSEDFKKMTVELEQKDKIIRVDQEYKLTKSDKYLSSLGYSVYRDKNNKLIIVSILGPEKNPFFG